MQGWQYGKGLFYLSSIFRLTKLAFLRGVVGVNSTNVYIYTGRYGEAPPQGLTPYPLYTIFHEKLLISHTLY